MEITWLGHSCFRLKGSRGIVITDPCPPETGYVLGKPAARIVTVSHQHPDHNYTQGIEGKPKIIDRPGEYEISDILILGLNTYHDGEQGFQRGRNIVFVTQIDDVSICHLGDLGHSLGAQQIEQLKPVDVLLLPVGGKFTIDAAAAVSIVRQLEPKFVIPMHYKTPALKGLELDTVDKFLNEIGVSNVVSQPKVMVTRSAMPESMQVVLLDYPQVAPASPLAA
jgi:L-ascorbate metabolism protein UlaG (beta-lactamase superfamily)